MFSFVFIFATACGEEEDQTENISINIVVQEDSYDLMYLYDVAYEFAEKYSQKQYSYQKKGVYVDVCLVSERNFMLDLQEYEDYDIYLTNQTIGHHIYKWANRGWLLSMDDVFYSKTIDEYGIERTLEDRLDEYALEGYKGDNFEYFALPHTSEVLGITYDGNSFDNNGFYFAKDTSDAVSFVSNITGETYYFTRPTGANNIETNNKSAGLDGIYNTFDDGLPKTLCEFIVMCEYIKEHDIYPFMVSGSETYKADYLAQALMTSLLGYDQARAYMDMNGEMEIVTGFTNEPLFNNSNLDLGKIYKPKTTIVDLTEETGYYTSWSLAKYYAEVFMDISVKLDWWADITNSPNKDQFDAMWDFVFSGYDLNGIQQSTMLIETSSWYRELEDAGILDKYNKHYNYDGQNERKLLWMALPNSFDGEKESKDRALLQVNPSYFVLANRLWSEPDVAEACRDFLNYISSEEGCTFYTQQTGYFKDLDYYIPSSGFYGIDDYYPSLFESVYEAKRIYLSAKNLTYRKSPEYFEGGKYDDRWYFIRKTLGHDDVTNEAITVEFNTIYECFKYVPNSTVKDAFLNRLLDKYNWQNYYGGYLEVAEGTDIFGNKIEFNK